MWIKFYFGPRCFILVQETEFQNVYLVNVLQFSLLKSDLTFTCVRFSPSNNVKVLFYMEKNFFFSIPFSHFLSLTIVKSFLTEKIGGKSILEYGANLLDQNEIYEISSTKMKFDSYRIEIIIWSIHWRGWKYHGKVISGCPTRVVFFFFCRICTYTDEYFEFYLWNFCFLSEI